MCWASELRGMLVSVSTRDVMQSPVVTASPADSVGDVAGRFSEHDVGSVLVVEDGRPVGIVTESTLVDCYLDDTAHGTAVSEVMAAPVVTVEGDVPIEAAAARMREREITTLPVCDADGAVVGIVSTTDLAHYLPQLDLRGVPAHERSEHRRDLRPDTAYEHDDWQFESFGEDETAIDVGDVVTFEKVLSDDDVRAFAEASGDTNRLHLDEEYAVATRFGQRIAHGTLVAGLVSAALARLPGLIVYLSQSVTYLGPVAVGDAARAECEVVESLGNDRYRLSTTVHTDGEQVIEGEATVMADEIPATD